MARPRVNRDRLKELMDAAGLSAEAQQRMSDANDGNVASADEQPTPARGHGAPALVLPPVKGRRR